MPSPQLREPKATLSWPFGNVSTDFVTYNWAVGVHPTVQFHTFSGKNASSGATDVADSQLAQRMGQIQTKMFEARSEPDVTVDMEDGSGGSLAFRGFMTGPTFLRDRGTYLPAAAAIGEAAIISNLKLDIYDVNSPRKDPSQPLIEASGVLTTTSKSDSLGTRLKELTEQMILYWDLQKQETEVSATTLALKVTRHRINGKGPLAAWYKLLENSAEDLRLPWLAVVAREFSMNERLNLSLFALLRQPTQDFMAILQMLCEAFQLVMIPSLDGTPGKLVPRHTTVTGEEIELKVPDKSMLLNGVNSGAIMPVQQVVVRGMPTEIAGIPATLQGADEKDNRVLMGAYPEEAPAETGNIPFVDLPSELQMMLEAQGFGTGGPPGDSPPSMTEAVQGFRRIRRHLAKRTNAIAQGIIDDFGKSTYVEMALGGSSATVTTPLALRVKPGVRYRIVTYKGDKLFSGFLAGITHAMEKTIGGGGKVESTLNFSHVTFGDFKLPGL